MTRSGDDSRFPVGHVCARVAATCHLGGCEQLAANSHRGAAKKAPTGSLWSQLLSEAVTGSVAGKRLVVLPAENITWGAWKAAHPETWVLSFVTGYARDYKEDPYAAYPLPRNPALLVAAAGRVKIYPFSELKRAPFAVIDRVGSQELNILYDRRTKTARIENQPAAVTAFASFLDDLKAFYPEAEIYRAPRR